MHIKIQTRLLQAATLFMPKTHPEKWMNGLTIEIARHQGQPQGRLIATDGATMLLANISRHDIRDYSGQPTWIVLGGSFINKALKTAVAAAKEQIEREKGINAPKALMGRHWIEVECEEGQPRLPASHTGVRGKRADGAQPRAVHIRHQDQHHQGNEIPGPVIDHCENLPVQCSHQSAYYLPDRVNAIERAHHLIHPDGRVGFRGVAQNGQGPGMAVLDDHTVVFILPAKPYQLPADTGPLWATKRLQDPKPAAAGTAP